MTRSKVKCRGVPVVEYLEQRQMLSAAPAQVIFEDRFSGSKVDASKWVMPHWRGPADGTYFGRTQLRCDQNSGMPPVSKGSVHMTLDTFNPTGFSIYGSQITTTKAFRATDKFGVSATIRAKLNSAKGGGVAGIFFYSIKPEHNEVDTELVTNDAAAGRSVARNNVYANEPLGVGHPSAGKIPNGGKLTKFHTYTMTVFTDKVLWYIDGKLVRTETAIVPKGAMKFYLNFWAPDKDWALAYNKNLKPVTSASRNTRLTYDVDSVVIKAVPVPKPPPVDPPSDEPAVKITSVEDGVIYGKATGDLSKFAGATAFIHINIGDAYADGWWGAKPYWNQPITRFGSDGKFSIEYITGGVDGRADKVQVFLVPKGFDVPSAGADPSLPSVLLELPNAVAHT